MVSTAGDQPIKTQSARGPGNLDASFFGSQFLTENRVQQNKTIYKMLNTEQLAIYLIFSLIVVVALFNLFGALIMMVIEKKGNIHTLLVLGLTKSRVSKIFFYQGGLISLVGCIIGLIIGVLLIFLQNKFSLFMITAALSSAFNVGLGAPRRFGHL